MYRSIFTDELGLDIAEALPIIKSWGLDYCDLRAMVFGKGCEYLTQEELEEVKRLLKQNGLKLGCLQTSLAKVQLPDRERQEAEEAKMEGIIRAADALDCNLVRSFFYWHPKDDLRGKLSILPDQQQKVLDMFEPLANRAIEAGLKIGFENCGVTADEVFTILDELNVPGWGLAWDPANGWEQKENLEDEVEYLVTCAQRSVMVHVKARGSVIPLEGEILPWARILTTCAAAGLEGPVSAETHNRDKTMSDVDVSHSVIQVMERAWPLEAPGEIYEAAKPRNTGIVRDWDNDPVGFVVVGLGMGHNRARVVTQTSGARLLGVCDLVEERAQRSAEEYGVPYTLDIEDWLDQDDVEVVYVMTPTGLHGKVARQAIAAGKHVLTTKPMDASLKACDATIRAAEEENVLLGVDFDRRFQDDLLSLQASVREDKLGRLLSGQCSLQVLRGPEYFQGISAWHGTWELDGGGVLSNQSIHHIDELAFALGIPSRVRCDIYTQTHEIEAEDLGTAVWVYDDGPVITFYGTTSYPQKTWYHRLDLFGTEGAFHHTEGGPYNKPETHWFVGGEWSDKAPVSVHSHWQSAADNMAAAVRTGVELTCTGRDGRRTQSILDAMYRSAKLGGAWVGVEPDLD